MCIFCCEIKRHTCRHTPASGVVWITAFSPLYMVVGGIDGLRAWSRAQRHISLQVRFSLSHIGVSGVDINRGTIGPLDVCDVHFGWYVSTFLVGVRNLAIWLSFSMWLNYVFVWWQVSWYTFEFYIKYYLQYFVQHVKNTHGVTLKPERLVWRRLAKWSLQACRACCPGSVCLHNCVVCSRSAFPHKLVVCCCSSRNSRLS